MKILLDSFCLNGHHLLILSNNNTQDSRLSDSKSTRLRIKAFKLLFIFVAKSAYQVELVRLIQKLKVIKISSRLNGAYQKGNPNIKAS